jgi:D-alanyl-D-alanine carboxypeptidase (penicillin-binding protein 5/6)
VPTRSSTPGAGSPDPGSRLPCVGIPVRRRAAAFLALALLTLALLAGPAVAPAAPPRELPAASWILLDVREGDVLASRAPARSAPVASATKLMTAYIALRELRPGQVVTAPRYRANPAESLMGLRPGERVSVRDLLYGLLLASGNDAAMALAQAAAGSAPKFVRRMNAQARRLGLRDTRYADPIGLDPGNVSSARDLVRLAGILRRDPLFRRIVATPRITLREGEVPRTIVNRNTLVLRVPWVDGVKTGHTAAAGYVLVASGGRRGAEFLSAVLGAPSEAARDEATLALLEYGVSRYRLRTPVRRGERLATVPLRFRDELLALRAARRLRLPVRRDQRLEVVIDAPAEVDGPIERGEPLGTASVLVDGERAAGTRLLAARSVAAATVFDRLDSLLPGGRFVLWLAAAALLALLVLGALALLRSSRARRAG